MNIMQTKICRLPFVPFPLQTTSRCIHTSFVQRKALENWKRPSIDELGVPKEPWTRVHMRNQKKFNMQLLAGIGMFSISSLFIWNTVFFNGIPDYAYKTGYVTKYAEVIGVTNDEDNSEKDALDEAFVEENIKEVVVDIDTVSEKYVPEVVVEELVSVEKHVSEEDIVEGVVFLKDDKPVEEDIKEKVVDTASEKFVPKVVAEEAVSDEEIAEDAVVLKDIKPVEEGGKEIPVEDLNSFKEAVPETKIIEKINLIESSKEEASEDDDKISAKEPSATEEPSRTRTIQLDVSDHTKDLEEIEDSELPEVVNEKPLTMEIHKEETATENVDKEGDSEVESNTAEKTIYVIESIKVVTDDLATTETLNIAKEEKSTFSDVIKTVQETNTTKHDAQEMGDTKAEISTEEPTTECSLKITSEQQAFVKTEATNLNENIILDEVDNKDDRKDTKLPPTETITLTDEPSISQNITEKAVSEMESEETTTITKIVGEEDPKKEVQKETS